MTTDFRPPGKPGSNGNHFRPPCRNPGEPFVYPQKGEDNMQYMLMCYFDEKRWNALPDAQRDSIMRKYAEFTQGVIDSGHFRAAGKLQPTATTTTVREKNGHSVITDGPFAETKEQLGGYHIVECKDLDEAISLARRIPTLPAGGTIEVRPMAPWPGDESTARSPRRAEPEPARSTPTA
jgi:hypothetical protein